MSGKVWGQVALATIGGLIILVGIGMCFAAVGGTTDPIERMEPRATGPVTHTSRATESAALAATPEVVCPTPEEAAYFDRVAETAKVIERASLEHSELLGMSTNNPAVTEDPQWRIDAIDTLRPMWPAIKDFRTVTVPESVQYIHVEFTQALDMLDEALTLLYDGYNVISVYKIEQGYQLFTGHAVAQVSGRQEAGLLRV